MQPESPPPQVLKFKKQKWRNLISSSKNQSQAEWLLIISKAAPPLQANIVDGISKRRILYKQVELKREKTKRGFRREKKKKRKLKREELKSYIYIYIYNSLFFSLFSLLSSLLSVCEKGSGYTHKICMYLKIIRINEAWDNRKKRKQERKIRNCRKLWILGSLVSWVLLSCCFLLLRCFPLFPFKPLFCSILFLKNRNTHTHKHKQTNKPLKSLFLHDWLLFLLSSLSSLFYFPKRKS